MPTVFCLACRVFLVYITAVRGIEGNKQNGDNTLRPCVDLPGQNKLKSYIAKLVLIRKQMKALCYGSYKNIVVTNHQLIFERSIENERILIAINAHSDYCTLNLNIGNYHAIDLPIRKYR